MTGGCPGPALTARARRPRQGSVVDVPGSAWVGVRQEADNQWIWRLDAASVARVSMALRLTEVHFMAVQVIGVGADRPPDLAVMNTVNVRNLRSGYST